MLGAMGGQPGQAGAGRGQGPPPNLAAMLGAMGGPPGQAGAGRGPPPNLAAMLGAMGGGAAGRPGGA